jgi:chloramphenicol 3-O phosphotransferase
MAAVILLNGTSSSGKTTIAGLLQKRLGSKWVIKSIDGFLETLPVIQRARTKDELRKLVFDAIPEFHRNILREVNLGSQVIIDHVLQEKEWGEDFNAAFGSYDVVRVGVNCSLEVLEKRERDRGDRNLGMAKKQFLTVHAGISYDLEVDTSALTAEECAERITRLLN